MRGEFACRRSAVRAAPEPAVHLSFTDRSPVPYDPARRCPYDGHSGGTAWRPTPVRDAAGAVRCAPGRSIVSTAEQGERMPTPDDLGERGPTPDRSTRSRPSAERTRPRVVFEVRDVSVLLRRSRRGRGRLARRRAPPDHRADRSVGVRQEHAAAVVQPHERPHRRAPRCAAGSRTTVRTCTPPTSTRSRCGAASAWCSRSRTRSRSRSTTTSRSARASSGQRKGLDDIVERALRARRAVGRGEGQAQEVGVRALRRAAAAAVHRALPRGRARRDPHGRAVLGARPDRDRRASRT